MVAPITRLSLLSALDAVSATGEALEREVCCNPGAASTAMENFIKRARGAPSLPGQPRTARQHVVLQEQNTACSKSFRRVEDELSSLWCSVHNESTEAAKAYLQGTDGINASSS